MSKKIKLPVSDLTSEQVYALLDTVESEDEGDIENLMNDSDTEFEAPAQEDEEPVEEEMLRPIGLEAVVHVAKGTTAKSSSRKRKAPEWKWSPEIMIQERKQSIYSDTGKVLLEFEENPSPIDVFIKCTGLDDLFSLVRDESQRYAMQNGRVFETNYEGGKREVKEQQERERNAGDGEEGNVARAMENMQQQMQQQNQIMMQMMQQQQQQSQMMMTIFQQSRIHCFLFRS